MTSDIINNLNLQELVELKEFYREKVSYIYTLIDVAINWNRQGCPNEITITSPNDSWRRDGSFVSIMRFGQIICIYVYSLDENLTEIRKAWPEYIKERLGTSASLTIYHVTENFVKAIDELVLEMERNHRWKLSLKYGNYFMKIDKEEALLTFDNITTITKIKNVYLSPLKESHASQINEVWPHKFTNSEKFVALVIKLNGGIGLFSKETNELVAWIVQGPLGHMNMLQTEDKYKGNGYGKIVLQAMSKRIAENGFDPVGTILLNNTVSINLFEKIGFRALGTTYNIELERSTSSNGISSN